MFGFKRKRAARLIASGHPRRIRVHSVMPVPEDSPRPKMLRVAFEFLDPPGPWSMQFYEGNVAQPEVAATLKPGLEAKFYESEDEARTRVLVLEDGQAYWPK